MVLQDFINLGFEKIAKPILINDGNNYKFALLREDGEIKDIKGKLGKVQGRNLNEGYWVYIFTLNGIVIKIGKAEGEKGMIGRFSSYQSGNPKYNAKNGPQNRAIYLKVLDELHNGNEIDIYAWPVPIRYEKQVFFGKWEKEFPIQDAKWHESVLIENYIQSQGEIPLWNENKN